VTRDLLCRRPDSFQTSKAESGSSCGACILFEMIFCGFIGVHDSQRPERKRMKLWILSFCFTRQVLLKLQSKHIQFVFQIGVGCFVGLVSCLFTHALGGTFNNWIYIWLWCRCQASTLRAWLKSVHQEASTSSKRYLLLWVYLSKAYYVLVQLFRLLFPLFCSLVNIVVL